MARADPVPPQVESRPAAALHWLALNRFSPARPSAVLAALVATALLVSCSSQPEKQKPAEPPAEEPAPADPEAAAVVDDLAGSEVAEWGQRVLKLDRKLRDRVARELSHRATAAGESMAEGQLEPPKEMQAVRWLLERKATLLGPMIDVVVWSSLHGGRQGMFQIFNLGLKGLPATLKCRRDKHKFVPGMIGYIWADYILGSFRNKLLTDRKVREYFEDELKSCPAEFRPHHEAVLAALGDATRLDALPTLLRSPVLADQQFAHLFLFGMFWEQSPYSKDEISGSPGGDMSVSVPHEEEAPWKPIQERALKWWEDHREAMTYDAEAKRWRLK